MPKLVSTHHNNEHFVEVFCNYLINNFIFNEKMIKNILTKNFILTYINWYICYTLYKNNNNNYMHMSKKNRQYYYFFMLYTL